VTERARPTGRVLSSQPSHIPPCPSKRLCGELLVHVPEFRSSAFTSTLERLGITQRRIRAGRPTSNGHVERLQQTILEECWRPSFARSLLPKLTALAKDLDHDLAYHNFDRAHTGRLTNGRIPADARKMKATR
jgi:transposase InsO family protein